MTEEVKLSCKKMDAHNNLDHNLLAMEMPLAMWFYDRFENDVVEVEDDMDQNTDLRGKNVLSMGATSLEKIMREAANYLVMVPLKDEAVRATPLPHITITKKDNVCVQAKDLEEFDEQVSIAVFTNLSVNFVFEAMKEEPLLSEYETKTVKELKADGEWPYSFTSNLGLCPYVRRAGNDIIGVEVGTCRGESAYLFLEKCSNIKKLWTIDPYVGYDDWNGSISTEVVENFMRIATENLSEWGDRVEMVRAMSKDVVNRFDDDSLDFLFIDGDHSYEAVKQDLEIWYPKLKKGGILAGHDYGIRVLQAVTNAVNDFRKEKSIRSPIHLVSNSAFFWVK